MWGNAMQLCMNGSMPPACHAGSSVCLHLVDHLRTRITIPMLIDSATAAYVYLSSRVASRPSQVPRTMGIKSWGRSGSSMQHNDVTFRPLQQKIWQYQSDAIKRGQCCCHWSVHGSSVTFREH